MRLERSLRHRAYYTDLYNTDQYSATVIRVHPWLPCQSVAFWRAASTPPSQAHGAMTTIAASCDRRGPEGTNTSERIAPAAITAATTAACVARRRTDTCAASHPPTSANTAPQIVLASLNVNGRSACGSCPES